MSLLSLSDYLLRGGDPTFKKKNFTDHWPCAMVGHRKWGRRGTTVTGIVFMYLFI